LRNTYTLSRLEQRIRQALSRPLTSSGEAAVRAFLSLTGISRWQPARLGILELSFVFDVGLPFGLIGENPTVRPIATRVGDDVCEGRRPEAPLWRRIHAAALLSHWGVPVEFEGEHLRMRLPGGARVEVPVGTAEAAGALDVDVPRLRMVEVAGDSGRHGEIASACDEVFAASPRLVGVVTFEPRFWVSVEQKEWIYRARVNREAESPIGMAPFDRADSGRRVLRLRLLDALEAQSSSLK
jgi:hypothetical protein